MSHYSSKVSCHESQILDEKNEKAICKLAVLTLAIHIIHANKICIINIIIFTIQSTTDGSNQASLCFFFFYSCFTLNKCHVVAVKAVATSASYRFFKNVHAL